MADQDSPFKKGAEVEISSDDEGFRGAWYAGTVIRPANSKNEIIVEYKTLMSDEAGKKPLKETLDVVQLRPPAPRERCRIFKFSEEVDAYHNDGWWEGVITDVHPNDQYSVFFRATREQMEFRSSDLRLHREWVYGRWVPSLEEEETVMASTAMEDGKENVEETFRKGTLVEVSTDEDGFQGAWFAATIVELLRNDEFLIEYQSLRNDDDTEFLKEKVDSLHLRPYPPDIVVCPFNLLEEVDALYNDGWWVGVISKVIDKGKRYIIYFRGTNEEMEFKRSDLRPHQEWIDGKWVMTSRALKV